MSDVSNEVIVDGPQLEYIDIINATKVMEAAIQRGTFSVKELAEVAPVVARFQEFAEAILKEQNPAQEGE